MSERYAGLFAALRALPDLSRGLCKGDDARLWDQTTGPAVERNLQICAACVERPACDRWARSLRHGQLLGVVGGRVYGEDTKPKKESA